MGGVARACLLASQPLRWDLGVSLNPKRRHMTQSQAANCAAKAMPLYRDEANKRQGTRTDLQAPMPESERGQARDHAAKRFNVSPRYLEDAKGLRWRRSLRPETGIDEEGKKVLLALSPGTKEDTESCRGFFQDMRRRGLPQRDVDGLSRRGCRLEVLLTGRPAPRE